MRFILINAVRDRSLEKRRKSHPGKVQRRPVVGGKPLPSGGRRILLLSDITPKMLEDIRHHEEVGNIRFTEIGQRGPVDMGRLAERCGFAEGAGPTTEDRLRTLQTTIQEREAAVDDSEKVVSATVGVVNVKVTAGDDGALGTDDDEVEISSAMKADPPEEEEPEEMDLEEVLDEEEEELAEDEWELPDDFDDYLSGLRNKDLSVVLEMLDGSSGGKRKSVLVDEILEAFEVEDIDPMQAKAALAKALSFGEGS